MILKGNTRSNASGLAKHLENTRDNDHVTVHELRGFASEDFSECLLEVEAMAKGTRCQKEFYSLSFNPPKDVSADREVFLDAIAQSEKKLGLQNVPRAIIFHEKYGRQHAHVVWSRIDPKTGVARDIKHDRLKLQSLSIDLYRQHGWELPAGLKDKAQAKKENFNLAEARRADEGQSDTISTRERIVEAWQKTENRHEFEKALAENNLILAHGRNGFVVVDLQGDINAVPRTVGLRKRVVEASLGSPASLPSAEDAKAHMKELRARLKDQVVEAQRVKQDQALEALSSEKQQMVDRQRTGREKLLKVQEKRQAIETHARADRLRGGLVGIWDRLTGRYQRTKRENLADKEACNARDAEEVQKMVSAQITERQELQLRIERAEKISAGEQKDGQAVKIDPADLKVRQTDDAKAQAVKKARQEKLERERKVEPPPPPPELDPNKPKNRPR